MAAAHYVYGNWDQALALAEQSREGEQESGNLIAAWTHLLPTALIHAARGHDAAARHHIQQVTPPEPSGDVQNRVMWCGSMAGIELSMGRQVEAMRLGRMALEMPVTDVGHPGVKVGEASFVDAAIAMGDRDAMGWLRQLIERRPAGHRPPFTRALLAKLRAVLDEDASAFSEAGAVLRAIPAPGPLARTLEQHAAAMIAEGRRNDAAALLAEAHEISAALGVQPAPAPAAPAATAQRVT